jgi:hypothetical protein
MPPSLETQDVAAETLQEPALGISIKLVLLSSVYNKSPYNAENDQINE